MEMPSNANMLLHSANDINSKIQRHCRKHILIDHNKYEQSHEVRDHPWESNPRPSRAQSEGVPAVPSKELEDKVSTSLRVNCKKKELSSDEPQDTNAKTTGEKLQLFSITGISSCERMENCDMSFFSST
ncbi:hypothetical protein CAPTEDRAFT_199834 [Capitella teleta]|uniref:Uncharacterized protein n=1 Tax=Capitella teleta TaxID=283909 RepID=R7VB30_CAPTE|nr:hypothetical protein CAPTEDRAFT_199834 [Capitella teleta]|eukprot:ELU16043.1 hypothetical protein CAPTEDRAFT_199834 [Capitella teleta]